MKQHTTFVNRYAEYLENRAAEQARMQIDEDRQYTMQVVGPRRAGVGALDEEDDSESENNGDDEAAPFPAPNDGELWRRCYFLADLHFIGRQKDEH